MALFGDIHIIIRPDVFGEWPEVDFSTNPFSKVEYSHVEYFHMEYFHMGMERFAPLWLCSDVF